MSPASRKALWAAATYWTSPLQVGSHHIARGLVARGWEVAYISDPISPWHLLGGVDLAKRAALYWHGGMSDLDDRLWAYVPAALAVPANQPLLRSGWVQRTWQRLSIPGVIGMARRHGFGHVDLLGINSFSQPFWLEALQADCSVFRVADQYDQYPKFTPAARQVEAQIARSVDVVAYTARVLEPYVQSMHPRRAVHFPNGLDFKHFAGKQWACPAEYMQIPRPIVVYMGALDLRFDSELVMQAVERLPQVSFVVVGPQVSDPHLQPRPNLYLLGPKQYAQVPAYLQHADVGIIPFDVARHPELVNGIHPLKLYQYLACGLPVVATAWQELESLNSPAYLSHTPDQFVASLQQALEEKGGAAERIEYASQADWDRRLDDFLETLGLAG